jgi:indole-3-glycerol phosphate synthase
LAERGGRRFSQAIAEGDGISVVVEVDGPEDARLAEAEGAEALFVLGDLAGVRDATDLPILTLGSAEDVRRAGADACVVSAGELDGDDGLGFTEASDLGLDCVVSVRDDEELKRVLDLHDPEIFLLAGDLERALELLIDVPVGKLAIARADSVTREQVVELERRGVDAVIVPPRNVAELVGDAPPAV